LLVSSIIKQNVEEESIRSKRL